MKDSLVHVSGIPTTIMVAASTTSSVKVVNTGQELILRDDPSLHSMSTMRTSS